MYNTFYNFITIMSTFKAFNSMLSEFIGDLADTFDEYSALSDAKRMLDVLLASDEGNEMPMRKLVEVFTPHKDLIMNKDPEIFVVCQIPLVTEAGFNLSTEWATLEDDNKEAIWNYVQQLYLTGSTVLGMSGDMLSSIELLAQGCIDKVQSGEMSEDDAKNPMVILQEMMKNPDLMKAFNGSEESS